MPWIAAAVMVVGAVINYGQQKGAAQAQSIINKANAEAANLTRQADNEFKGAAASLANFMRAENNKKQMRAAGEAYNALSQNMYRQLDTSLNGTIQERLAASEQLGELAAASAAAGLGGGTVDSINNTMRLRNSLMEQQSEQNENFLRYDAYAQRAGLLQTAVESGDYSQTFAGIDYSRNVAEYVAKPSALGAIVQAFGAAAPYIRTGLGQNQMNAMKRAEQQGGQGGGGWFNTSNSSAGPTIGV